MSFDQWVGVSLLFGTGMYAAVSLWRAARKVDEVEHGQKQMLINADTGEVIA